MRRLVVGLASPRPASSLDDGLERVRALLFEAASRGAEIACFPEAYLPGLRGQDSPVPPYDAADQERVLGAVRGWAREGSISVILGMEWIAERGRQIAACVIDSTGSVRGLQTKNQLDPTEEPRYVPGDSRQVFEVRGVRFGVAICHEGWRYPETVRWAAARGARIVFHPQRTGSDSEGIVPTRWGDPASPYYEKAMVCRALENTIYFASVNYALRSPESATSLIDPSGACQAHLPYGQEGVLVEAIDPDAATGLLAARYAPERYKEEKQAWDRSSSN